MWNTPKYMDLADSMLNDITEFWEPYLVFEKNMNPIQISVFVHLASYFWRLDNDDWFSENIPKNELYRSFV